MARLGVSYEAVEAASATLLSQGKQPTIELIRQVLGTGSSTTIANHLRQWRAYQVKAPSLPTHQPLPEAMIQVMAGLWEKLCEEAKKQQVAEATAFEIRAAEFEATIQKYQKNNQRWQQLFNQWIHEKDKLTDANENLKSDCATLEKAHDADQLKLAAMAEQLQEKEIRIQELHRLHAQTQLNLEHYRESIRLERLREAAQYEKEKEHWCADLNAHQKKISDLEAAQHLLEGAHLTLQCEQSLRDKAYQTLEEDHRQLKTELHALQKIQYELRESLSQTQREAIALAQKNEAATLALIDAQSEIKYLSRQLGDEKNARHELETKPLPSTDEDRQTRSQKMRLTKRP